MDIPWWLRFLLGPDRMRRLAVEWLYIFHFHHEFSPAARHYRYSPDTPYHPVFPDELERECERQNR